MARQKNDQVPLGELLIKARLDKHMSRAQLAKASGIRENSLVRYENAGLESDGQYPPSPKLAKLCFVLGIPPITAMFSSLSHEEFWEFKEYTWENWLENHPDFHYLIDERQTLLEENRKLTACFKMILGPEPKPGSHEEGNLNWMKAEALQIMQRQEAFDERLKDHGVLAPRNLSLTAFPGNPTRSGPDVHDYTDFVKNGPDQDDPSRSNDPNNDETVGAVSISHDKGGG